MSVDAVATPLAGTHDLNAPIESDPLLAIAADPGAFLQQIDIVGRRALFMRVAERELRAASFLDERLGLQGREGFWLSFDQLDMLSSMTQASDIAPGYIFHIGHCGSTLLSRLLDQTPSALGLREPLPLRDLASTRLDLDSPLSRLDREQWQGLLNTSLQLLSRAFCSGQRIIIKATSTCNNLVEPVLQWHAGSRAILLYIRLEPYLATMAKAPGGGLDALNAAPARLRFLHGLLDDQSIRLHELDPAESLAMGWIAEMARFQDLAADSRWDSRLLVLDFEQLLADLRPNLDRASQHLGLADIADAGDEPHASVLAAYAKNPAHTYSTTDRDHDLDLSRRRFSAEISRGMQWAERIVQKYEKLSGLRALLG